MPTPDDMRQGVTPTQNAILDRLARIEPLLDDMPFDDKWREVRMRVGDLGYQGTKRDNLINAAAFLISMVEELGE